MKRPATALVAVCWLLGTSCSDTPVKGPSKEPEKAPEPLSGRRAFQEMYPMARSWASDAMPVQLQSINLPQVKSGQGTAGAWQAIFYSAASGKTKSYTWSAVEAEGNLHQGVFAGPEESLRSQKPFRIAAIQKDSDDAYKVAFEKSADYVQKNPNKPVLYFLELTNRFPQLAWRVVWGDSVSSSDYSVFVDAATGQFLEKVH